MSLINEALKKAQHQRTGGSTNLPPMPGGGSGGGRGNSGMPKGTLMLLLAGAFVVIAISVVATVFLVNRTPAPKIAAATPVPMQQANVMPAKLTSTTTSAAVSTTPAASVPAPSPVIFAPVVPTPLSPATTTVAATPSPATGGATPAPTAGTTAAAVANVAPAPATTPTVTAEPVVEGTLSDRINNYLDKLHVTGVRTLENGVSKVLMNERVYRVNDIVNRSLGLKLTKIAPDSLTFVDATGTAYVKTL